MGVTAVMSVGDASSKPFCERRGARAGEIGRQMGADVYVSSGTANEAPRMSHEMLRRGVPGHRILIEDESDDTTANMRNSRNRLEFSGYDKPDRLIVVTSWFHALRVWVTAKLFFKDSEVSVRTARDADVPALGRAVGEALIFIPNVAIAFADSRGELNKENAAKLKNLFKGAKARSYGEQQASP